MRDEFLWVEKYRPKTISDTILPDDLKKTFQQFVDQENVPNLLLTGSAGVGKTTVARAMLEQLGCDYIILNGSDAGRKIDTLRTTVLEFASTVSFSGGRKYVILDEADYMNAESVQPALRNYMEEFSKNCGFILTCNFKNKIIAPLHSRCSVIEFKISKEDKMNLAAEMFKRCQKVLTQENVKYDKQVLVQVVQKYFPDNRRILNELQRYSATGAIDTGILSNMREITLTNMVKSLKEKDFTSVRKWVAENSDTDSTELFRKIYDKSTDFMNPKSIPQLVLILADYQHRAAFVADHEINTTACLTEIMANCEFN